ncbi:hypothetical protein [Burkholderia aenigmatica]|uniref:hypothetical protein n=1 Tax=Burkholderia aenigmatica TaxID=2015348 RepID=UPI002650A6A3|nr:hypothetical protein [Burkholderia aenigmatica]MDN7878685.1 hypothetical protein [Burkholderia aenigmatica]
MALPELLAGQRRPEIGVAIADIVIVIRSVAAIAASGAGHPAAGQLTRPESGHFYVAKSGHLYLAATTKNVDNYDYVKSRF